MESLIARIANEKDILKQLDLIKKYRKLKPLELLSSIKEFQKFRDQLGEKLIFVKRNLDEILNDKIEREVSSRIKILEHNEAIIKKWDTYKEVIEKLKS